MDELLQHCLRELAFEGALGCSVTRLRDFVNDFYAGYISIHQTLDNSYHNFVWSLMVQQPSVRIGVVPDGQISEIYVPPQPRAGRRENDAQQESLTAMRLGLILDAHLFTLEELVEKHGENLRVSLDPEMCFVAITGSHAKPAKLTPMVYAALQLISRSRERGISVLDIGKMTGYDQKTCFYLIKQLVDLDLVVKLRRGGTSQNFCVHKYFFDFNPTWTRIREEEHRAQQDMIKAELPCVEPSNLGSLDTVHFDPIDERHLASLNILRQRLIKLLKHSPGCIRPYVNIAVRVGFRPRSRTERRFFLSRLKELINEGTVEKVLLMNPKPGRERNQLLYLRLVSSAIEGATTDDIVRPTNVEEPNEEEIIAEGAYASFVRSTATLHKQIIDIMEDSSATGITLSELSDRLGSFDKRTLDLLISRMERQEQPTHLADLSVIQVLEFHGRERRYRFFTLANYQSLMDREGLQETSQRYTAKNVELAQNFMELRKGDFYETHKQLLQYLDKWAGKTLGRPQKRKAMDTNGEALSASKRDAKERVNPILPDGTRKRGRPLKDSEAAGRRSSQKQRRTSGDEDQDRVDIGRVAMYELAADSTEHKGVKRKLSVGDSCEVGTDISTVARPCQQEDPDHTGTMQSLPGNPVPPKRRRGRPPKLKSTGLSGNNTSQKRSVCKGTNHETRQLVIRDSLVEEREVDVVANALDVSAPVDVKSLSSSLEQAAGPTVDSHDVRKSTPSSHFSQKTNISALRRENEIVRMIDRAGGIVNTSAIDFMRMFMEFVEGLVKAGETTSAPIGSKADRRTLSYSLDKLESAGRIKTMTSMTGTNRMIRIAYLPGVEEEKLRGFVRAQTSLFTSPSQKCKGTQEDIENVVENARSLDQVNDRTSEQARPVLENSHKSRKDRLHKPGSDILTQKKKVDTQALSAEKCKEAARLRAQQWDAMVDGVHPSLLKGVAAARLRRLRQSFVRGSVVQSNQLWEMEIREAIRAAERCRSSRKLFSSQSASGVPASTYLQTSFRAKPQDTEADRIIPSSTEMQMDFNASFLESGDPSISEAVSQPVLPDKQKGRVRRQRFQWTSELDDLLCDASVIIRSRCRTHHRVEWAALDRVFPHLPRSTVRMRLSMLKAQPGAEAYLQRLENSWHERWTRDRGTPDLPDDNPRNPLEFDIKAHIGHLRKNIDKNAIRVGMTNKEAFFALPINTSSIFESWVPVKRGPPHSSLELLFNSAIAEDTRGKFFREMPLTLESDRSFRQDEPPDSIAFAGSVLKIVVGTPNEVYDADLAADLLNGVEENAISSALDNLLSRNIMSKLVRDPKRLVPGRTVKISEVNQNALGGSFSQEFFQDASQLEESYSLDQSEWHEWSMIATEGDTAAILQQISNHNVLFDVDTTHTRSARAIVEGNSRKADDDDIELDLRVKFIASLTGQKIASESIMNSERCMAYEGTDIDPASHGKSMEGKSCRLSSGGIIDCLKCLNLSNLQVQQWDEPLRAVAKTLLDILDNQGSSGIKIEKLMRRVQSIYSEDYCIAAIRRLSSLNIPLVCFTGYNSSLAVSAKFLGSWTVMIPHGSGEVVEKIYPRRWLDIRGNRISEVWNSALRAIVGLVHVRPGLTLVELRWRLRAIYDRQEIIDVLNSLTSKDILYYTADSGCELEDIALTTISLGEEKAIHWFIREETHWYCL